MSEVGEDLPRHLPWNEDARPVCVTWFPDSRRLLVGARLRTGLRVVYLTSLVPGRAPTRWLDGVRCGYVSPDGRRVAFQTEHELRIASVDEPTSSRELIANDALSGQLAWSPDSSHVAFLEGRLQDYESLGLIVVDIGSGRTVTVARGEQLRQSVIWATFAWLPDGRLVHTRSSPRTETTEFVAVDPWSAETSSAVIASVPARNGLKALSIDGQGRLVFVGASFQSDTWVAEIVSPGAIGVLRKVSRSDEDDRPSGWTADSRSLYVVGAHLGSHRAFVQPADGSFPEALALGATEVTWPMAGPRSGDLLYWRVGRERSELVLRRRDVGHVLRTVNEGTRWDGGRPPPRSQALTCGGEPRRCLLLDGRGPGRLLEVDPDRPALVERTLVDGLHPPFSSPAISNDSERIVITNPESRTVVVATMDGRLLGRHSLGEGGWPQYTALAGDGHGLYGTGIYQDRNSVYRLVYLPFEGQVRTLWSSVHAHVSHVTVSPDGRYLAVAITPYDTDVWMLTP